MKRAGLSILLAILCAALLLAGCASPAPSVTTESGATASEPEPAEPTPAEPEPTESIPTPAPTPEPGPFSADYERVWETLETDYPYLDYLRSKGVQVDQIRAQYAEQARMAQEVEEFVAVLDKLFYALQNTAHLGVITAGEFPMYYSAYIHATDAFHEPWRDAVFMAAQSPYYTLPEDLDSLPNSGVGVLPPVKVTYYEDCRTLCLTIDTFRHEVVERDRDVIWQAIEQYPEAENIVFDISGNSGGDTRSWTEHIVGPFGEDYNICPRMFYRASPRNRQLIDRLFDNYPTAQAQSPPPWAEELGLDRYIMDVYRIKGEPKVHSDARRWVLVSGTVYSSAEQFVYFCKATGWATVIGRQTGGDGVGFDPVLYRLPDSGLLYRFSIVAGENPDGSMSLEGTTPDVELKVGNIQFCLEYIRNERSA